MKKVIKTIGGILAIILALFLILLIYLSINEYKPADIEDENISQKSEEKIAKNKDYKIMTWNIGYGGLDKDTDFFMDGGEMVFPINKDHVEASLDHIVKSTKEIDPDLIFFQEVDKNSKRSYNIDQVELFDKTFGLSSVFSLNYKVDFVPFPLPPLGRMESGIMSLSKFFIEKSQRHQQSIPHKYPVRLANLKRAFQASYLPIKDSDKNLVLVNVHLDAYESGNDGRLAQTKEIIDFVKKEYQKGNYVLVGGDFNQDLTGKGKKVPEGIWNPSPFPEDLLEDFTTLYYGQSPTSVVNDKPYTKDKAFLSTIDGFIVSDNIEVKNVETIKDQDFQYSDHNPVLMEFVLK